jgi:hypothetical protein
MDETKELATTTLNEIEKEPSVMDLSARLSNLRQTKVPAIKNEETKQIVTNAKIECKDLRKEIDGLRKKYGEPFRLMLEGINGFFRMMADHVKTVEDKLDEKIKNHEAKNPTAFANGRTEKGTVYMREHSVIDSVDMVKLAGAVAKGDIPATCITFVEKKIKDLLDMGVKVPGVKWHKEKDPVGR